MNRIRIEGGRRTTRGRVLRLAAGAGATLAVAAAALSAWSGQSEAQDPKPEIKKPHKTQKASEAPTTAAASTTASTAASAAAAATPPGPAVRTETATYDQWTVVCQSPADAGATPAAKRACTAVLKVTDPNRRQVVFAWVLARTPDGRVATVIQAPTGVQVQRGLTLKLGEAGPSRTLPFVSCEPQNCEVDQVMDDAALRDLGAASQAVATIVAKDGRGIQFTMPLKGIDKALAAVRT